MSESCCGGGCCGPNESYKTDTDYSWEDRLSELRVRCGFGRMSYSVEPGLYRCGGPTEDSPVLVTANYKMSFDRVRRNLTGRDAWILVLDTKGVNVWCAAGKGTFGSDELVDRVTVTSLESVVSHRTLIVPQLGATGVSAHRVKALCGWNVRFGPIRAEDLPEFLDKGMKASEKMRKIDFPLADRLVLVPVDIKGHLKYLTSAVVVFYLLSGMTRGGYSTDSMLRYGSASAVLLVSALITPESWGKIIEIGSPDVLTYAEMMMVYAHIRGLRRLILRVPVLTPRLSSYWVHWITPVSARVATPLIEGLRNDLTVRDRSAKQLFPDIDPLWTSMIGSYSTSQLMA